ncbi:Hpc2p KNAG_0M00840 [Huiozyma naganishii CBS 8797]|uniref:Hpc2-related domain-containing protein n=1 Tax=Huiozyma naganishii (strain ATCC MYA-139 / BCRC 22969 / CBS 8797 / KCTC 17520 / NBRC 10181 / NCYC 3082 / Yp74L-3) TaxID=1071383 RepID=J7S407_HUIN7|nr:hypothetical protein KNAG_0M00840 [Kazachstania naganishii CBS 8797]CCK72937.1 hypothetical protein KNAG_0M00840 [Kazachstania naganishii CBS 8797]
MDHQGKALSIAEELAHNRTQSPSQSPPVSQQQQQQQVKQVKISSLLAQQPEVLERSQSSVEATAKQPQKAKKCRSLSSSKKKAPQSTVTPAAATAAATPAPPAPRLLDPPPVTPAAVHSKELTGNSQGPAVVLDVPLYPADGNEYLDENGTVVVNVAKLLNDTAGRPPEETQRALEQEKRAKREQLVTTTTTTAPASTDEPPKKKSHPMKGKSLIGKYDMEDPFIDDTELLWEEQRAATKDGFFVYFGPLIAKGQVASFERINGTMKKGGIRK